MAKKKRTGLDALREYEAGSNYAASSATSYGQEQTQTKTGTFKRSGLDALREYEQYRNPGTVQDTVFDPNYRSRNYQTQTGNAAFEAYKNAVSAAKKTPAGTVSGKVSGQEYGRSPAMQQQYGTYQNYLRGVDAVQGRQLGTQALRQQSAALAGRFAPATQQNRESAERQNQRAMAAQNAQRDQVRGMRRTLQEMDEQIAALEAERADTHFSETGLSENGKSTTQLQNEIETLQKRRAEVASQSVLARAEDAMRDVSEEDQKLLRQYRGQELNGYQVRAYAKYDAKKALNERGYGDETLKQLAEWQEVLDDYENAQKLDEAAQEIGGSQSFMGKVNATLFSAALAPAKALGNVESLRGVLPSWAGGYQNEDMPTNVYSPMYNATRLSSGIRQSVMQDMGPTGQFLYQAGTSALDSAVNMAVSAGLVGTIGGVSGAAAQDAVAETMNWVMGSQVAADSVYEGVQSGKSNVDALVDGIVEGAIEGITEKYSVGEIIESMLSGKAVWKKALRSFGSEGAEEVASNWLNRVYDVLSKQDRSEVLAAYEAYIEEGRTPEQALAAVAGDFAKEDGLSFLAGGLSGLAMAGTYAGVNRVISEVNITQTARAVLEEGEVQDVIDYGMAQEEGTKAHKLAEELQQTMDEGGEVTQKAVEDTLREVAREQQAAVDEGEEPRAPEKLTRLEQLQQEAAQEQTQGDAQERTYQIYKDAVQSAQEAARAAQEYARTEQEQRQQEADTTAQQRSGEMRAAQRAQRAAEQAQYDQGSLLSQIPGTEEIGELDPEQYARQQTADAEQALDEAALRQEEAYLTQRAQQAGYDEQTAAYFLNGNTTGLPAEQYAAGFERVYEQGRLGASEQRAMRFAEGMNQDVAAAAYQAGLAAGQKGGTTQYSIAGDYRERLRQWNRNGRPDGERFALGTTGAVLQGLGAVESDIYMNGDKISTILNEHPEITMQEVERIPEILEDPVLILKSRSGRGDNSRMVLFGSVKAQNGQPVMAVLDLRATENGFLLDDMQKVNSAYTKKNPAGFITSSEVMFADEKRAIPLLRRAGLTIASQGLLRNGYVGSISYEGKNVKLKGVPFTDVVQAGQKGDANGSRETAGNGQVGQARQRAERAADGVRGSAAQQQRADAGRKRAEGARALAKTWDEVTVAALGLGESETGTVRVMPEGGENASEDLKRAVKHLKAAGVKNVRIFAGQLTQSVNGQTLYADAAVMQDGTVLIRADSAEYSAFELAKHESYHILAKQNPAMAARIRTRLLAEGKITREMIESYVDAYARAYGDDMDAYLEEIVADAYAGMNRTDYGTNQLRTDVQMEVGQWKKKTGSARAPPAKYSFARLKDGEVRAQAEAMETAGKTPEDIWRELGVVRTMDGKGWRYEIDDSGMEYNSRGDNHFRKRYPGYSRYKELLDKANRAVLGLSQNELTENERNELAKLKNIWETAVQEGQTKGQVLEDFLVHDDLFRAYPQLRGTRLEFRYLETGENGYYDRLEDTIVLSEKLRRKPESTLLHEIQHVIQSIDKTPGGASPGYWNRRMEEGYSRYENDGRIAKADKEYRRIFDNAPEAFKEKVREINRARLNQDYDAAESIVDELYDSEYAGLWSQLDEADFERRGERGGELLPSDLYRNTAGEIEARDAATRRSLAAEDRRNLLPKMADENTVFTDSGWQNSLDYDPETASIKEQIENSRETLNEMEIVANATVPTNLKSKDSAAAWATERLKSTGYRIDRQGYGEIYFSKKDIDKGLRYSDTAEEKAALAVLPQVLKRGIEIGDHANHKNRAKKTITFAAPVELNGQRGNMAVVVNRNGNHYYTHRIVTPDGKTFVFAKENAAQELSRGVTVSGSLADTTSAASETSISKTGETVKTKFSASAEQTQAEQQTQQEDEKKKGRYRDLMGEKPAAYVRGLETRLVSELAENLSVPAQARREVLRPIAEDALRTFFTDGQLDRAKLDELFETAYQAGVEEETEFWEQYGDLKKFIRDQKISISEEDRADIADFNLFRKAAMGTLTISKDGLPVDVAYQQLREEAPELFPAEITAPGDQLMQIYDVAKSIHKVQKSLDEYYGSGAKAFKDWQRANFTESIDRLTSGLRIAQRYLDAQEKAKEKLAIPQTEEETRQMWAQLKDARRAVEKAQGKTLLTEEDQKIVNRLLRGETSPGYAAKLENGAQILRVYEAKAEYDMLALKLKAWNVQRRNALRDFAEQALTEAEAMKWADKASGIQYSRETMERNIRDIARKGKVSDEKANAFINKYFWPVHENESKRKNYIVAAQEKIRALKLDRQVRKGNMVSESYAVQWLGEAEFNRDYLKQHPRVERRGGMTFDEWNAAIQEFEKQNPEMDLGKVRAAVRTFHTVYDQLFQDMNRVRIENGYEPVNYLQGYFPHFQESEEGGNILQKFARAAGIEGDVTPLPATINGLTAKFRPGIRYMANVQQRLGYATAYDALQGFDRYIEVASDVIYHTADIQRLRALATQIRWRASDEGLQARIDAIRTNPFLNPDEANDQIANLTKDGRYALSNFVDELDEYTNLLAGKKSRIDRGMEKLVGRRFYNVMKKFESRVGANMVAANVGSALTNFIPITQAWSQVSTTDVLRGMWDTLKNYKQADGLDTASSFINNRSGYGRLATSTMDKVSAAAGILMEGIDGFTTGSVVRARYYQNLRRGMSEANAMQEADQFAAGVMADRSKGSTPTLYSARNPLVKLFTQFQLEVNNELSWIFKDMAQEERKKGVAALAKAMFKFLIGAWIYNEFYEAVVGRRAALDPLDIINDTVGDFTGYQLPNTVQSLARGKWDFEKEKPGTYQSIKNLEGNILSEFPGTQALTLLGVDEALGIEIDGGRIAVASAIPNLGKIEKALLASSEDMAPAKKAKTITDELIKPGMYVATPFGGGQLRKLYQGGMAAAEGGSYTVDNEGNDILQYPVYNDNAADREKSWAQALLFGKTATEEAQKWVESGFKSLSAKETAAYQAMTQGGVSQRESFAFVNAMKKVQETEARLTTLFAYDIPQNAKTAYYYAVMAQDTERARMDTLSENGVGYDAYMQYRQAYFKAFGTQSASQERVQTILDGMNLTKTQKAAIWTAMGKDWKEENNPYK